MRTAVAALIHRYGESPTQESLRDQLKKLQTQGLTPRCQIIAIKPSLPHEEIVQVLSRKVLRQRAGLLILKNDDEDRRYKWIFGSLAETAALSATVPTLVLQNSEPPSWASSAPSILLALDSWAPPTARALRRLARVARPLNAIVHVIHVKRRPRFLASPLTSVTSKPVNELLKETTDWLHSQGVSSQSGMIVEGRSIAEAIDGYAETHQIWITAVTSPPRSFLHRIFWGSTTQKLLRQLKGPLMVLRVE